MGPVLRALSFVLLATGTATGTATGAATGAAAAGWAATSDGGLAVWVRAAPQRVPGGDPVSVQVTVTNRLSGPVRGVSVDAPDAPDCARRDLGTISAGASVSYGCQVLAGRPGAYRSPVTATGTATGGWRVSATTAVRYTVNGSGYYPTPSPSSWWRVLPPVAQPPLGGSPSPPSASPAGSSTPSPPLPLTGGDGPALWAGATILLGTGVGLLLLGHHLRRRHYRRVLG